MGNIIYSFFLSLYEIAMNIASLFHPKAKKWVVGRKKLRKELEEFKSYFEGNNNKRYWFHCASLGEFEQGRPVIENIKEKNPKALIILTFFSPSGYEVQRNYNLADLVCYLPLDKPKKVVKFLNNVQPDVAVFVKYEIWPNFFSTLKDLNIPLYMISAIFRENQRFFNPIYGNWFAKPLQQVSHFFVQNETSAKLLSSLNIKDITVCGDTRFDRVIDIASAKEPIPEIKPFISDLPIIIMGSSWPDDEKYMLNYYSNHKKKFKLIVAPHEINKERINLIKTAFGESTMLFSEIDTKDLASNDVLIVDNIGLLSRLYSTADLVLIGGGFGQGIHNTIEAAVYGMPILFGPNFSKFQEAKDLIKYGAAFTFSDQTFFNQKLSELLSDKQLRTEIGEKAKNYVQKNKGATTTIVDFIK